MFDRWFGVMGSEDRQKMIRTQRQRIALRGKQDLDIASPCQWTDSIPRLFLRFAYCACEFSCSNHSSTISRFAM